MSWDETWDACTIEAEHFLELISTEKHAFVLDLATHADAGSAWLDSSQCTYKR